MLRDEAIAAHGGAERWARLRQLRLRVRVGGNILALRFKSPRTRALEVTVDTRHVNIALHPFPRQGLTGIFDGTSVRIEDADRRVVRARDVRRDAEGRVIRRLIWDDLDLLYFLGYALWNYAVTPFVFTWPGVVCREGERWQERNGASWRRLHVTYPFGFPTHSPDQTFYFDDAGLLRRLDYTADVFGSSARGAHYCEDHRDFGGIVVPTHRVVYTRGTPGHPIRLIKIMEGWIDDVQAW